ncbi:peptidase U32 [Desulfococcus multivorans]|nr:peptidase U32 [Desulfococcus multivorans]
MAPAGNRAAFLAALAAGADAVYCGLKDFSARMAAKNFNLEEMAALTRLAHERGTRVYITLNTLIKPDELASCAGLVDRLNRYVNPDGLILQDLAVAEIAREVGYNGELHLSTLANVTFPRALESIRDIPGTGFRRIVLPRELNVDEIKQMADACPDGLDLEVFVHGALCYAVSGRCYWSSYMGGKSGLRGRCVQPCRRLYTQQGRSGRYFSCQDLSIDVLVKVLLTIPKVSTWKIEGRKKGPHYVYYTVKAYQMLRDHFGDVRKRRDALDLLTWSLGRTGTHYHFLPQRPQNPVNPENQTGSGYLIGRVKGAAEGAYVDTREALLPGDVLRVGYEDEPWHSVIRVGASVPKKGRLYIKTGGRRKAAQNAPVFLTDRREKALMEMIDALSSALPKVTVPEPSSGYRPGMPTKPLKSRPPLDLRVGRRLERRTRRGAAGLWLSPEVLKGIPQQRFSDIWWWLPPVVWPDEEDLWQQVIDTVRDGGGRTFVLNAPWQTAFFRDAGSTALWAGPFCNIANPLAVRAVAAAGFKGCMVSPELGAGDYAALPRQSPIPLGIVLAGNWPLCISRIVPTSAASNQPVTSPRGEVAWIERYGQNTWIYPNWRLNLEGEKKALVQAGYRVFVTLDEPVPRHVQIKDRPGWWNWKVGLA